MDGKIFQFLLKGVGLVFAITAIVQGATSQQEIAPITEDSYTLSQEIEAIIEKYQDPDYVEQLTQAAKPFEHPDFIHKILHPREAALEATDALNKKVLYEFSPLLRVQGKKIAILGCDVIGVSTHLIQKFLDRRALATTLDELASLLTEACIKNHAKIIAALEADNHNAAVNILVTETWQHSLVRNILRNFLLRRLPLALLEFGKKTVTPPPFFIHGKTEQAKSKDIDAATVAPVTSLIPAFTMDTVIDPILNGSFLLRDSGIEELSYKGAREDTLITLQTQYALEGAKQLDLAGTIDEGMLFCITKELIISIFFFHKELQNLVQATLKNMLKKTNKTFNQLLTKRALLETQTNDSVELKKSLDSELRRTFSATLNKSIGLCTATLRHTQCVYNVGFTALLLTPAACKIVKFCWSLLKAFNKPLQGKVT